MKNHIAIKFIAILLCTVTLLGSVGSALGLYIMTEADLYNKTADQVREALIWDNGEVFAREAALCYASMELGGCSESMVENHFGGYWYQEFFRSGRYSYTIADAEGNEIYRQGDDIRGGTRYSFPVTGQYLHLVSAETEQERGLREAQERTEFYGLEEAATVNGVRIPIDGLSLTYVSFVRAGELLLEAYYDGGHTTVTYYEDGNIRTEYQDHNQVGDLLFNQNGNLVFRSNFRYSNGQLVNTQIVEANFFAPGDVSLQLRDADGVGTLYSNDLGTVCFTSLTTAAVEEPKLAEAKVQAPELTVSETAEVSNTIPKEGTAIAQAAFYGSDGTNLLNIYDENGVGYLHYNMEEGMTFLFWESYGNLHKENILEALGDTTIAGVFFQDLSGEFTYQAAGAEGVGSVDASSSGLFWRSEAGLAAQPVVIEETLPPETEPVIMDEEHSGEEGDWEEASYEEEASEESYEEPVQEDHSEEYTEEEWQEESSEESHAEGAYSEEESYEEAYSEEQPQETVEEEPPASEPVPVAVETVTPRVETVPTTEEAFVPTEPVLINGKPLEEYKVETDTYRDPELNQTVYAGYVRIPMPEYTVVLQLAPNALRYEDAYTLLEILRENRHFLLPALAVCLLLFAICVVYLCTAAGRKPRCEEVRAGGLNRLPLDLYFSLAFFGVAVAVNVGEEAILYRMEENVLFCCALGASLAFLVCLLFVAFCFAVVAQIKTPGGFWWRNSLCGQSARILLRFALWLEYALVEKVFPFLARMLKGLWKMLKAGAVECWRLYQILAHGLISIMGRFFRWFGNVLHRFLSLLPITWQWLLAGCVIIFLAALCLNSYNGGMVIFGLLAIVAIILYGAQCFGTLSESARKMSKGDLNTKVEDKLLLGCFKDFAGDLNDLADVAVVAAQKQLKSERMKSELITNVSHDIKTPLTSIINYVDLLQKSHTQEEREQYLEVLSRQSLRLKKLIDDLMDMSKANTGNMAVEITTLDAVESVNQALGEFADKLTAARLTPVFRHTEEGIAMKADGKLVWRVLSNLLSNAVKYAMPGTRLYVDLMELEGKVVLSLKNISREELNVDADELMERFVRGDDSRNTEGSGLGLNIARSLMELQKGQLQLLVDGDLFKVTLIFPGA